jgi:aminocarboxymuconate-semialdehyde decarboxylase
MMHGSVKPLIIDIHSHIHCDAADELVNRLVPREGRPVLRVVNELTKKVAKGLDERWHAQLTTPALRIADMDRAGIDVQLLSSATRQYYYWIDGEIAGQTARLVNDRIAEMVAGNPRRFQGIATLPMQAPERALAELHRAMTELRLHGIVLGTNIAGADLSEKRFRPIFAAAQELGAFIFIHPFANQGSQRTADHHLDNVIGNPLEETIAISRLIFDGVLKDFPNIKICVAHGGGYAAAYAGRMDHAYKIRPDARTIITEKPTYYLKKLYFDTLVFTHHQLEYLAEQYGSDHILMGTDYPYDMGEEDPVGFVNRSKGLGDGDKTAILSGNAARLLGLPARV